MSSYREHSAETSREGSLSGVLLDMTGSMRKPTATARSANGLIKSRDVRYQY